VPHALSGSGVEAAPQAEPLTKRRIEQIGYALRIQAFENAKFRADQGQKMTVTERYDCDELVKFARAIESEVHACAATPERPAEPAELPAVLFDGRAVYAELDVKAHSRTSADNVSDVLDAVVRLLRKEGATARAAEGDALDAARYRWLRHADLDALAVGNWGTGQVYEGVKFDDAIDRAMADQQVGAQKGNP